MKNEIDMAGRLRDRLEQLDKKRVWLADRAAARGIASRRMVLNYLAGTSRMTWETACQLAELVGLAVTVEDMAPPPTPKSAHD